MKKSVSYVQKLRRLFPAPENPNVRLTDKDIEEFEKAIGTELPEDYYEFLKVYGSGSFNSYFYVECPFAESIQNPAEDFLEETRYCAENYAFLEKDYKTEQGKQCIVDCKFTGGELEIIGGNAEQAEYMRIEEIDSHTRSKILFFGNHFPYDFYPEEYGMIYWGHTDDADFFLRFHGDKTSVVIYDYDYYEFDMSVTEFIYEYLTGKIKLPMGFEDEPSWEFERYE